MLHWTSPLLLCCTCAACVYHPMLLLYTYASSTLCYCSIHTRPRCYAVCACCMCVPPCSLCHSARSLLLLLLLLMMMTMIMMMHGPRSSLLPGSGDHAPRSTDLMPQLRHFEPVSDSESNWKSKDTKRPPISSATSQPREIVSLPPLHAGLCTARFCESVWAQSVPTWLQNRNVGPCLQKSDTSDSKRIHPHCLVLAALTR